MPWRRQTSRGFASASASFWIPEDLLLGEPLAAHGGVLRAGSLAHSDTPIGLGSESRSSALACLRNPYDRIVALDVAGSARCYRMV